MERKIGWNDLFLAGSVVDLDVGMWSARTKIKAADLGIDDSPEVHKALSLGCHRLVPKDAFDKVREIAWAAKRAIESHSLNFPFIRGARYVPDAKMGSLIDRLKKQREAFDAESDRICADYQSITAEMLPVIRKALLDATGDEEIAKAAYDRVLSEYPSADEIRSKFYIRWNVYAVSGAKSGAIADTMAQETESVKSIVRSMIEQLREEFSERLGAVTAAIAKGGKLNSMTIESTREVLDRVESMNLFGDSVLADQVWKLRGIIDTAERNGKIYASKKSGFLNDLTSIQREVEKSAEDAVAEAEANLTGLGRRKFNIPTEGVM